MRYRKLAAESWYHGSNIDGLREIVPGQPSNWRKDIPREDAVYITSHLDFAKSYGKHVYEVQPSDQSKMYPDEDTVYELLEEGDKNLRSLWERYTGYPWTDTTAEDYFIEVDSTPAPDMINFAEWLVEKHPDVARRIIDQYGSVAYLGTLAVVRQLT